MNEERTGASLSSHATAIALSAAGALGVAFFLTWLTYGKAHGGGGPEWIGALPTVAACANAACAVALACGWVAIRARRIAQHRNCMLIAVGFSAVFFAAYVTRHHFHGDTPYTGAGMGRAIYLAILATHILGSLVVLATLPLSLRFAAIREFASHRAVNRWLLPVWFYVSVTGVIVYFMLR